ncbi:MAG TPA: acylphosphatase [Gaiellaceae bacterium]|nr:acylphosphatase [Gaiellaceae bacterium]
MVRRKLIVHGRVQGVGFRFAVARAAAQRGVAGWARNRPDGAVEVVLEGEEEAVAAVAEFCRRGPRGASVTDVEATAEAPTGLSGFETR